MQEEPAQSPASLAQVREPGEWSDRPRGTLLSFLDCRNRSWRGSPALWQVPARRLCRRVGAIVVVHANGRAVAGPAHCRQCRPSCRTIG